MEISHIFPARKGAGQTQANVLASVLQAGSVKSCKATLQILPCIGLFGIVRLNMAKNYRDPILVKALIQVNYV